VFVHFDMPGRRATHFLGRSTMLADGSAQLAVGADALVVPVRARRAGHRIWVDAAAPLDPRQFADADELHDALAAHHERWILENPAAMEHPAALTTSAQRELLAMRRRRPSVVEGLEINEVRDGLTVYDPATDRIHYLSATAAIVFSLCDGLHTVSAIARLMAEGFGLDDPPYGEIESCVAVLETEQLLR
jgi:Coenzyme PQQ synthesis protein D (PqqD)